MLYGIVFREGDQGVNLLLACGVFAAVHYLLRLTPAAPVEFTFRTLRKRQNLDQAVTTKPIFL